MPSAAVAGDDAVYWDQNTGGAFPEHGVTDAGRANCGCDAARWSKTADVDGDGTIDKTEWDFGTGPTPTLEYRPQAYSWQLMVPHTRSTPEYEALLRYWREQQSAQARQPRSTADP